MAEPDDDFDDDVRLLDGACTTCGHHDLRARDCWNCGGEGFFEMYDDDPLWYDEGDTESCEICNGRGINKWCQHCEDLKFPPAAPTVTEAPAP